MKKIALCGVLTALALAISLIESWIPLALVVPVPGIKLGLANIVTVFALVKLSPREAVAILLCRVLLASIFAGSMTSFLFSLLGGMLSLIVMWLMLRNKKWFSIFGVCIGGAAAHNVGQIIAAIFVLQSVSIITYLPVLLLASIPLGFITGYISRLVLTHLSKMLLA